MQSLRDAQAAMSRAITHGPDHVPEEMFEGSHRRIMMAFASHANTVSHARLVALEETFPLTRNALGEQKFNELSRAYLDGGNASAAALGDIGADFAQWLEEQGNCSAKVIAEFEWAWLESYRAAEAIALRMRDLSPLDETSLLNLQLALHPAARKCTANQELAQIVGFTVPEFVMLARPEAEIRIHPMTAEENSVFALLVEKPLSVRNLFTLLSELIDQTRILPAIIALVGAGAVVKKEQGKC